MLQLLKEVLELEQVRTKDGRTRFTIKQVEETLTFDKGFYVFVRCATYRSAWAKQQHRQCGTTDAVKCHAHSAMHASTAWPCLTMHHAPVQQSALGCAPLY